MSVIVIKYDGIDITDDVVIDDASFTSKTDGGVGEAYLRVKDLRDGPYDPQYFQIGKTLTLDIDGKRVWGGYLFTVTQDYAFPVVDTTFPEVRERFWELVGVDYNILFTKRLVYNKADPTKQLKIYDDAYVSDNDVIEDLVTKYLDVGAAEGFVMDGNHIDLRGVDVPYPRARYVKRNSGCEEGYQIASPGMTWADAMRKVTDVTACVFYIAPRAKFPSETWPYEDVEHVGPWFMYHPNHRETGPYELNDADPGNVRDLTHTLDGTLLANDAHVWGAGMGSQGSTSHVQSYDPTSIATYGRFQWGDFSSTMWTEQCLSYRAASYVYGSWQTPEPYRRGHRNPREIWTCTLFKPDFQAGDVVAIRSHVHGVSSDGVPIREMKVTFPTPTDARFDLVLSHEITPPWGTSMWWDQPVPRGGQREPQADPPWQEFIPYRFPMTISSPAPNTDWTFLKTLTIDEAHYRFVDHNETESNDRGIDFLNIGSFIGPQNHPWYNCSCGGVGLGCYGPETTWRQGWYGFKMVGGLDRHASTFTAPNLFIPSQYLLRFGTGGKFAISFVTDPLALGERGAPMTWTGTGVPGVQIGEIDITGMPCEPSGICARDYFFQLYCNLGGQRVRDSLYIPGSWIEPFYWSDETEFGYEEGNEGVHNWIVFTPLWRVPEVEVCHMEGVDCDSGYFLLSPGMQGQETSGTLRPQTMTAWILGNAGTFPLEPDEISAMQSAAGARQVPSPDLDVSGKYHTSYPYVPGTLEVFFNGMPLILGEDFWEASPSTGAFNLRMQGDLTSQGGVDVAYQRADLTSSAWDDWVSAYHPTTSPEGDTYINRVYRPLFQSQLGWGTAFDGVNCAAAAGAILAERHTFGISRPTPPEVRSASGITSGGLSITDVRDALWDMGHYVLDPGVVNYDTFISYLSDYRGAMLTGNSSALVPWDLNARSEYTGEPFVGWHSLYINEVRADGYLYVYDPAFRVNSKYGITPGWYPAAAIKAYAAERTGSTNLVWAIYTQRQGRI